MSRDHLLAAFLPLVLAALVLGAALLGPRLRPAARYRVELVLLALYSSFAAVIGAYSLVRGEREDAVSMTMFAVLGVVLLAGRVATHRKETAK